MLRDWFYEELVEELGEEVVDRWIAENKLLYESHVSAYETTIINLFKTSVSELLTIIDKDYEYDVER